MGSEPGERAPARSYRSSRRQEQARHTRRRVIEAATSVFVAQGYAVTTMRAVAAAAGVSVPTVESLFGTKARLLKDAIDVAIAGDDEPVPVLDRDWTVAARNAVSGEEFLDVVGGVIGSAQARSAGLVLAVFEGSAADSGLAGIAAQMIEQREVTAGWIVDGLTAHAPLRADLDRQDAVDTVWILMDPALFDRLVRRRGWTIERYQAWFARSARRLLIHDTPGSVHH
ncbi:TetR family transcriptional regulator [Streptosporangiaceae bacterium NEAU-GS5]|nr:TetR family transcriptional regulator [Streptosporangiaceae bacterium NEAU-GS5]